ncbi:MAG TPA: DUF4388 domain-containing protein [Roseiflexaceae bacterium]|nr:DUF4388 domain-containing protein [Roseiflexaceae bacterium]
MFFHGNFALLSPLALLQAICGEQHSVQITAWRGTSEARVALHEGRIIDAECDDEVGDEAVYHLVSWDFGQFMVTPLDGRPSLQTVTSSTEQLLQEAARRRDDFDLTPPPLPPYPSRQQLESLLRICPALSGVAMVGYDGRLMAEVGLPKPIAREAAALTSALVAAGRALHSTQTVIRFGHASGTLLLADWGQSTLVLATPTDEAAIDDAVVQLSAGMFATT